MLTFFDVDDFFLPKIQAFLEGLSVDHNFFLFNKATHLSEEFFYTKEAMENSNLSKYLKTLFILRDLCCFKLSPKT